MSSNYQDPATARNYLKFLESENGKIQQTVLWAAIQPLVHVRATTPLLEAGCGSGWLTGKLYETHKAVWGVDSSAELLSYARKNFPGPTYLEAPLDKPLPFIDEFFGCIVLNMVAPDLDRLSESFHNLYAKLSHSGQLLVTIPNPYYTYPVAEWKRNLSDLLLFRKPSLILKQPYRSGKIVRKFNPGITKNQADIESNFYTLNDYLTAAHHTGFSLTHMQEITSATDSPTFNLTYQLYRYPLFLLLEFTKP